MKSEEKYKEKILLHKEDFPAILSDKKFTSSNADTWTLWRIFFIVAFISFACGFWFGIPVIGLMVWLYYSISKVIISVKPTDEGIQVLIKENNKKYELLAPLKVNTLWKYDKNKENNSLDTMIFLQLKDARGTYVTFYERRVLDGRFPYESKHTKGIIKEPDLSFQIQRVDLLMEYLGIVLPDDMVSYDEDLES